MPTDFASYFQDPVTGSNPFAALSDMSGKSPSGLPNWADPIGALLGGLGGGLFGGDDKKHSWKKQGDFMVHTSGKFAPVPISDIPGTVGKPSQTYKDVAENVRILETMLPYFSKAVAGQIIPQEEAKLAASQVTSPKYAQLMTDLYEQFGPQLNQIGNEIARTNAMETASRDRDVLAGPGKELLTELQAAMQQMDPEFYATRELTSNRLADLMKSIDLSGALSETERREIEQGLAREGVARGTANAPNQSETVANAMQYGQAGRNRQMQNQNNLSQAIAASTQFLPASRTGVDPFLVATGRASVPNTGENKFTGITTPGNEAQNLTNTLFGNVGQTGLQNAQIDATAKLNEKDWLDQFSQFAGAFGNLTGGIAGIAGAMCWVAREVYGEKNPRWQIFRQWLLNKAPTLLRNLYIAHGQRFAWWIHDKPKLKTFIRHLMNNVIRRNYVIAS